MVYGTSNGEKSFPESPDVSFRESIRYHSHSFKKIFDNCECLISATCSKRTFSNFLATCFHLREIFQQAALVHFEYSYLDLLVAIFP